MKQFKRDCMKLWTAGKIIHVTKGVYFARSGPAQILIVEGDAWNVLSKIEPDSIDAIITDPPFNMGTQQWLGKGTTRPHAFMDGKRTYEQHDIDEQWLRKALQSFEQISNMEHHKRRQES